MRRFEGALGRFLPLALCAMLACLIMPALAYAEGTSELELSVGQIAGDENNEDTETAELEGPVKPVEPIAPAVGSTHKVGGCTYKVTSAKKKTAAFFKSKVAKSVTVPATVKIKGGVYKVTAISPKAFTVAKKRLTTVSIGKNVGTVGASAFYKCAKLAKVKGGAGVKTIGAKAFFGCSKMKACSPFSSKKLAKVGKNALGGAKKMTVLTVKSKKLKGKSVKGSLKGSSVKTVKVKVGSKKLNKKYQVKYKKVFAKKYSGKKVAVK